MRIVTALGTAADRLDKTATGLADLALAVIMAITLMQVFSRYVLGHAVNGVIDITAQFLMPIVVMFGITVVERDRGHIRIVMLYDRMPTRLRSCFDAVGTLVVCILFMTIVWATATSAYAAYERGVSTSGDITVPLFTALIIPPLALSLLVLRLLVRAHSSALLVARQDEGAE